MTPEQRNAMIEHLKYEIQAEDDDVTDSAAIGAKEWAATCQATIDVLNGFDFVAAWNSIADSIYETAREKGWWDESEHVRQLRELVQDFIENESARITAFRALNRLAERNDGELIALMHSELSEALEGLRHGNPPSDKIGDQGFSQVEEEFADVLIRMADMAKARDWDIGGAVVAKMAYNEGRAYKHGGKKF